MSLIEDVREHAAQIQAHARTALQEISDHMAAHPEDAAMVTEAMKVVSEAASDAVDTLKAGQKAAPAAGATGSGSHGGGGGGSQRRE